MNYHLITLGCPKNNVDSEGMHGLLLAQGHRAVNSPEQADVVIVNTCSFIQAARDETIGVLRGLAKSKRPGQQLIAAGCMAESHREQLAQDVPGIDATLSTKEWMRIGEVIAPGGGKRANSMIELMPMSAAPAAAKAPAPLIQLTPIASQPAPATLGSYGDWRTTPIKRHGPSAYLKISDGCNLRCAFCAIPSFKGDLRSKAMGAILGEARELVEGGVKEIILVAQHLTDYGRDLKMQDGLAVLLRELCQVVPEDRWIRLMYAYPSSITPSVMQAIADHPQIASYLDMPLQHAHPDTLRRMRRPPDTDKTRQIINDLRATVPNIAIRTTFIVGFPGETRDEFETLLAFLDEMEFDRAGFFKYSNEPGTHAATLGDQVSERVKQRRLEQASALQQQVSLRKNQRWAGQTLRVLVEGSGDAEGRPIVIGRSFRDAPEIDNFVWAFGEAPAGSFVDVKIEQANAYDLWGSIVGQSAAARAAA
jgi:ribosomal protein S12 methylthiotransferase